ncbi:MAG: hypothetical protein ACJAR2_002632 [Ilumatobacter sp.]
MLLRPKLAEVTHRELVRERAVAAEVDHMIDALISLVAETVHRPRAAKEQRIGDAT